MKAEREDVVLGFKPYKVSITVESKEEAQALYAIFNLTDNMRLIGSEKSDRVKTAIGREHYVGSSVIANGITYSQFYQSKPVRY